MLNQRLKKVSYVCLCHNIKFSYHIELSEKLTFNVIKFNCDMFSKYLALYTFVQYMHCVYKISVIISLGAFTTIYYCVYLKSILFYNYILLELDRSYRKKIFLMNKKII